MKSNLYSVLLMMLSGLTNAINYDFCNMLTWDQYNSIQKYNVFLELPIDKHSSSAQETVYRGVDSKGGSHAVYGFGINKGSGDVNFGVGFQTDTKYDKVGKTMIISATWSGPPDGTYELYMQLPRQNETNHLPICPYKIKDRYKNQEPDAVAVDEIK